MKLPFSTKFKIWASLKTAMYNKKCDRWVERCIRSGEILGAIRIDGDAYWLCIRFKHTKIAIWVTNLWYGTLTHAVFIHDILDNGRDGLDAYFGRTLWKNIRPSRRMELHFFEWLASQCETEEQFKKLIGRS